MNRRHTVVASGIAATIVLLLASQSHSTIMVTNGDFTANPLGASSQRQNVDSWNDTTPSWSAYENGSSLVPSFDQHAGFAPHVSIGYIYQTIGTLEPNTASLDYSFDQGFFPGTDGVEFNLRFFSGVPTGTPADGTDIDTLGLSLIGSAINIPQQNSSSLITHTGSVDVSALAAGTPIWIDFTAVQNGVSSQGAPLDNIVVNAVAAVPEPSSLALLFLGTVGLVYRSRRGRRRIQ